MALVTEKEVAEHLGVSIPTIRRWRLFKQGPRYRKIGHSVRYDPNDLAEWVQSQPSGGTCGIREVKHAGKN